MKDLMSNFMKATRMAGREMHLQRSGGELPKMHPGQGRLLSKIARKQPVSQKDLVQMLDIRPSSMSELLGKLEAKGLVERKQDENDKRNMVVTLTAEGESAAKESRDARNAVSDKMFAVLTDEEKEQLNTLLAKLTDAWKESYADAGDEMRFGPHGPHFRGHGHGHHMHHCSRRRMGGMDWFDRGAGQ